MVSCTDLLWDAPQPSRTAHCAANWIKLMLEKNLDQKFDLTQKLEQFPEKKVGSTKSGSHFVKDFPAKRNFVWLGNP